MNILEFLYIGLMIDDKKPSVVEFNCRFGDPETQPLLFRINSDIFDLFYFTALKKISDYKLESGKVKQLFLWCLHQKDILLAQ